MKRAFVVGAAICALAVLAYFALERVLALRALTAPPTPESFVQASWTVYKHGPGHRVHVSEQGIACGECHAQAEGKSFDRPSPSACGGCHEDALRIRHAEVALDSHGKRSAAGAGVEMRSDCLSCHGFGPDPQQQAGDCMSCHSREKHDTPAVAIHAEHACNSCHDVHENKVSGIDCGACHKIRADHGGHTQPGTAQCLECHHAHAPARSARERCVTCHSGAEAVHPVAASAATHGHTCTGCHAPHDFTKSKVQACSTCHKDSPPLAGAGHQTCTSCHPPHDVSAPVRRADVCADCHRDIALTHAAKGGADKACTSCHTAHPARPAQGPKQCSECHREIAHSELSAHAPGIACTGCHQPHDFLAASRGHQVCSACHAQRIKQLAATGHARCEDCHQALPHGGMGREVSCGQCHQQANAVHAGHAQCVQCHDAHSGSVEKRCESCHAPQAAQLHPKHGKCQNCHEPHQATPNAQVASCSGCHAPAKLPALHQVEEHRPCQACHQAHPEAPPGQAATCRGCHQDQRDHQPEATQCNGCHPFEAPPARRTR